ncbi:MAG: hypothetical protein Q4E06_06985 [Lautropia sp.]|nr:hypothetical protein [Lautropia sp.]
MSKPMQPLPPSQPAPPRRRALRTLAAAVATPPLALTGTLASSRPDLPAFDEEALADLDRIQKQQPPQPGRPPLSQTLNGWGSGTVPDDRADRPFTFGFIGDTPYNRLDQQGLKRVMAGLDDSDLAFVLHVGDIKSRGEACSNMLLLDRLEMLDRSRNPLVYTPGDNEWTDCGWVDPNDPYAPGSPLDRLHWLRQQVYHHPESLGARRMRVEQQRQMITQLSVADSNGLHQPRLPENMRWRIGSLQFCTIHVVGSNNGMFQTPAMREAWALRQQANAIWLTETAVLARRYGAKGLVIATHANMRFEKDRNDGWNATRQAIISTAAEFGGPVALLHGDTHIFRTDRLLLQSHGLENFVRVECFGSPFTWQWVTIRWNPEAARPIRPDPEAGPAFKVYTHHA